MSTSYREHPFYAWQSNIVVDIQKIQRSWIDIGFDIVEIATTGPLYPIFIFGTMVLFDFLLGVQMAIVLAFNVMTSLNLKYWIRGGRPFWTNWNVAARECHVKSFGFPSGHVQAPTVILLYFWLYMIRFKLMNRSQPASGRGLKRLLISFSTAALIIVFLFLAGFSRVYSGVHFFHDLVAGYGLGVLIVLFHMFVLVPFVVRPLARYVMNGKLTQMYHVMLIHLVASLLNFTVSFLSTTLPLRLLHFPDNNWKIISNTKCEEPITAFSGYQNEYFLLLGFLYGMVFGLIYCLKYKPFVSHTQGMKKKLVRLLLWAVLLLPCACIYFLESLVLKKKLTSVPSEIWSFVDTGLGLGFGLYFMLFVFPLLEKMKLMEMDRNEWNKAMDTRIGWIDQCWSFCRIARKPVKGKEESEEQVLSDSHTSSYVSIP